MGFSLLKIEIGDDFISKALDSAGKLWESIDSKHPVISCLLLLSIPLLLVYFIYTWGKIRVQEKKLDERVNEAISKYVKKTKKTRKGGKK